VDFSRRSARDLLFDVEQLGFSSEPDAIIMLFKKKRAPFFSSSDAAPPYRRLITHVALIQKSAILARCTADFRAYQPLHSYMYLFPSFTFVFPAHLKTFFPLGRSPHFSIQSLTLVASAYSLVLKSFRSHKIVDALVFWRFFPVFARLFYGLLSCSPAPEATSVLWGNHGGSEGLALAERDGLPWALVTIFFLTSDCY